MNTFAYKAVRLSSVSPHLIKYTPTTYQPPLANPSHLHEKNIIPILLNLDHFLIETILPPQNLKNNQSCARARNLSQRPHQKVRIEELPQTTGFARQDGAFFEGLAVGVGVDAEGIDFGCACCGCVGTVGVGVDPSGSVFSRCYEGVSESGSRLTPTARNAPLVPS